MRLLPAVGSVADTVFIYDIASRLRGSIPLTGSTSLFDLPDITSTVNQTVFAATLGIEDVGLIEVLSLFFDLFWQVKGNGVTRWQVSGDGGLTFTTIIAINFNVGVFTPIERAGTGTWITSITPGKDKFQLRLQNRAVSGTISSKLDDFSFLSLQYRRKITA